MAKDQKDLTEFFEVEELESRLEMCWAACADACCGGATCNGVCPGNDAGCVPINGSCSGDGACGGGGGGE